ILRVRIAVETFYPMKNIIIRKNDLLIPSYDGYCTFREKKRIELFTYKTVMEVIFHEKAIEW
ncbi:hypothetical protein, partial [Cytobacillus firmus]|uniref:hypothetical protein n=1 Tax=Cytobacillus firmus TaxID=1399 RepID=UPI002FFE1D20